ncbi:MAG: DNA repair protein RadC [Dehalococcoidia bacterium]|nr:DNA repair protein RadC [Dehalococcoidia bacterium]MDW8120659.1 DNA repair protein RadC [Chloroflexota bacterium]
MHDLPPSERPRERLRTAGPGALSHAELLAIILRTGQAGESALSLAQRLLATFGGLGGLANASFAELERVKGLGMAKAAQVHAALELGKRLLSLPPEERPAIRGPEDVASLLMADMALLPQESLRVVLLNTRNQVLGIQEIYKGNVHTAVVRTAEVFREAVRQTCPSLIVVHNHPSGDPSPSPDDVEITRRLVDAGHLLDIEVLDHIVIGKGRWVSLKAKRLGFP